MATCEIAEAASAFSGQHELHFGTVGIGVTSNPRLAQIVAGDRRDAGDQVDRILS
jgi:hypothetical protein